jgi:hypothetical protein
VTPRFALKCAKNRHLKGLAQIVFNAARRRGELEEQADCAWCGSREGVEAHHEDYAEPLAVVWVCRCCHFTRHAAIGRENAKRLGVRATRERAGGTVDPRFMEIVAPWSRGRWPRWSDRLAEVRALIERYRDTPPSRWLHLTRFREGVERRRQLEARRREWRRRERAV